MRSPCIALVMLAATGLAGPTARADSCDSLQAVEWLVGDWVGRDGDKTVVETWKKITADTFEGSGTTTRAGKPAGSESLRLVRMADGVFYLAKVAHNPLPIAFELTQCSAQALVFENPAHDFPRKLEYRLDEDNNLSVRVSDSKDKGFTLAFRRRTD